MKYPSQLVDLMIRAWANRSQGMGLSSPTSSVLRLFIFYLQVVHLAHQWLWHGFLAHIMVLLWSRLSRKATLITHSNLFFIWYKKNSLTKRLGNHLLYTHTSRGEYEWYTKECFLESDLTKKSSCNRDIYSR